MRDAIEVLSWDGSLVAVKVRRVLDGVTPLAEADDDAEHNRRDAAHTAGLVRRLLCRDRHALLTLYEWEKSLQDPAIGVLACSERMLRAVDSLFPECKDIPWPDYTIDQ